MRYAIILIWSSIIGQIVGYIGGALNHQSYNPVTTAVVALIAGLLVILLGFVIQPTKEKTQKL